ncbi:MAG: hypothetical protein ACYDHG_01430 [Desulfomonilaceae bacterium]
MKRSFVRALKRNETYIVTVIIAAVFFGAMVVVAFLLRDSLVAQPYETLRSSDLKRIFVTGYLRFREEDGSPYLKVELHNGTLWWVKSIEFKFAGKVYTLSDSSAFKPLHFGAVRLDLKDAPQRKSSTEYDLKIIRASGYPPAEVQWERGISKVTDVQRASKSKNY